MCRSPQLCALDHEAILKYGLTWTGLQTQSPIRKADDCFESAPKCRIPFGFVEDQKTGVGVEQTADLPISRFNFWSIRTTICPEAYIHLVIEPGQTARWSIRYRFYAK